MLRVIAIVGFSGCGRIGFALSAGGDGPNPTDGVPGDGLTDGMPGDGPMDTLALACQTDARYTGAAGLANTYREGTPLVSWMQARLDCMADDADLWVVESTIEQAAFDGDWTGITDVVTENNWKKLDGTSATFLPFATGEPDGGNAENCIRTDDSGFEDRDCDDLRDYVCECPKP